MRMAAARPTAATAGAAPFAGSILGEPTTASYYHSLPSPRFSVRQRGPPLAGALQGLAFSHSDGLAALWRAPGGATCSSACSNCEKHGTTVRTELLAGLTTFMTMAYIIFVNPAILADAGMDRGAIFVATCLAAAFASAFMGLYANYPVALAPGMGLNAYFTYGVVKGLGHSWETALGAVFLSGILFLIVSLTPIREWVINSIPRSLKMSIAAGIGLFLAIIGLQSAGIIKAHPATLVTLGDLKSPTVLIAALGLHPDGGARYPHAFRARS